MDQQQIRDLENAMGAAIAEVLEKRGMPQPPRAVHFMAKAAVAVLEAVVENARPGKT